VKWLEHCLYGNFKPSIIYTAEHLDGRLRFQNFKLLAIASSCLDRFFREAIKLRLHQITLTWKMTSTIARNSPRRCFQKLDKTNTHRGSFRVLWKRVSFQLGSRLTLFGLYPFIWLRLCNRCSLACFLLSTAITQTVFSWNYNTASTGPEALFKFHNIIQISKPVNNFVILTWLALYSSNNVKAIIKCIVSNVSRRTGLTSQPAD
jgi:hypothetical protein